jgi:hypothetical protein
MVERPPNPSREEAKSPDGGERRGRREREDSAPAISARKPTFETETPSILPFSKWVGAGRR